MDIINSIVLIGLLCLSWVDIKSKMIPVLPVVVAGGILAISRWCLGSSILELFTGMVPGAGLLFLAYCTKEGIGTGDALVLGVLGIACGAKQATAILGLAFVLAAFVAILLLTVGKAGRKTEFPFLPCVLAGYIVVMLR